MTFVFGYGIQYFIWLVALLVRLLDIITFLFITSEFDVCKFALMPNVALHEKVCGQEKTCTLEIHAINYNRLSETTGKHSNILIFS